MDLYKRRRGEWSARAKGIERDPVSAEGNTERPKSKLELARERFAAKEAAAAAAKT